MDGENESTTTEGERAPTICRERKSMKTRQTKSSGRVMGSCSAASVGTRSHLHEAVLKICDVVKADERLLHANQLDVLLQYFARCKTFGPAAQAFDPDFVNWWFGEGPAMRIKSGPPNASGRAHEE